jgi:CRP-like cAMP-binding protein
MNQTLPDIVARTVLLRGASEAALALLACARLSLRPLAAGEYVFRPGDAVDAIYLLLGARMGGDGLNVDPLVQVELKPPSSNRSLRFERIVHGEIFGELEVLEQGMMPKAAKRTTSAFALTPAAIVALPLALLFDLFERDEGLRSRVVRIGSQRLLAALAQQHDQLRTYPDLLLADWLVELSADIGIAEGNRVRFPRKIAQSDIAADLGVSRETISRRLNEWERSGLLRTGARSQQIEILDYQRISRLASLRSGRSREALQRTIDDIDAAIANGDLIRARNMGLDVIRYYPSSPDLHHRIALAAARGGNSKEALELLARSGLPMNGDLPALEETVRKARKNPFLSIDRIVSEPWVENGFGEHETEETHEDANDALREGQLVEDLAALHARLLKEQAFAQSKPTERRKKALASFQAYNALFEHKHGYYPGINAATMALIADDEAKARQIAATLIASLQSGTKDYWPLATLAEALLICGKRKEAKAVLAKARRAPGADDGAKASTILQFRRLGTVLDDDIEAFVQELRPRNVASISGHMFRGAEMGEAEQRETEAAIRRRAAELFTEHNVGFVYGALACGSDIILAETALVQGIEFNAVLPFSSERFSEVSVNIGDPPGETGKWDKRFRAILDRSDGARSLTVIDPGNPVDRNLDGYFFYGFRYAAGCALQRAAMLQTRCRLMVVSDQTEADNIAGTNRVLSEWQAQGLPFDIIPYPQARARRLARAGVATAFRPVIFLWETTPLNKGEDNSLDRVLNSVGKGLDRIGRTHRDGRRGVCLVAGSTEEALTAGLAAVEQARKEKLALRIICDFGLVLGADPKPDRKLVARLRSADDLPGSPLDCVLATESYAAQAKFDLSEMILLTPVGRAEAAIPATDGRRPAIRNRPSLPIYAVQWAAKLT